MCDGSIWEPKPVSSPSHRPFLLNVLNVGFGRNVAEVVIEKGYASVVRHRRDDEDRSSDYDKLMAAEQT